jgi:hypothetical protein
MTRRGLRPVLKAWLAGVDQPIVRVKAFGREVVCTPDHEIWVQGRGFVRADELRPADSLVEEGSGSWWRWLNTTGRFTDVTPPASVGQTAPISAVTRLRELLGCIGGYGKIITEKFLKDSIFTIKMAIREITGLTISNAFLAETMFPPTTPMSAGRGPELIWPASMTLPNLGIPRQRGGNGIVNMLERSLPIENGHRNNALIVNKYTLIRVLDMIMAFVQINASRPTDENKARITKLDNAHNATSTLRPINTQKSFVAQEHAVTVEEGPSAKRVYDLTVDEDHEFFVNGILVSNCVDSVRYALDDEIMAGRPTTTSFASTL